ncbi:MAG: hypothetical protein ACMXYL_03030 [Candidatus Woesearchaeota archaeon]
MEDTIIIKKEAIKDLVRIKEEFDLVVESLELMSDPKFVESYNNARKQIRERDFDDWD